MQDNSQITLQGIPAAPGIAQGPALVYVQRELEVPQYVVSPDDRFGEVARFESAILRTREQISRLRTDVAQRLGENEANIFEAHLLVLEDPALIEETIREQSAIGLNIEAAFQRVVRRYVEAFSQLDDDFIKERVTDIRDVARRLMQNMLGTQPSAQSPAGDAPRIVVAEDLSPSDTAAMEKDGVLAFVTDMGSRTSHAVIMARSMGIPAVVGLHNAVSQIPNGSELIVDGFEGTVVVNPAEETRTRYGRLIQRRKELQRKYESIATLSSLTADKKPFILQANIGGPEDVAAVRKSGAEGVGLYRTENLFIRTDSMPDEQTQFEEYRKVLESLAPLPVTVRTLDLGGDKSTSQYRFSGEEANPFMGFRAIRYCLENPEVFKQQLRAILRASAHGKAKIMFPMISSVEEMAKARAILEEAKGELRHRGQRFDEHMEVGAMIEVPSAALIVDLLAEHCDFFSIGTNDLVQYTIAIDRVNERVAGMYEPMHPAILRLLDMIFKQAKAKNKPVSVCGEIAGETLYAPLLLGLGAHALSASAALLPEVKYFVRHMRMDAMEKVAKEIVTQPTAQATRAMLKKALFSQLTDLENHPDDVVR